MSTVADAEPRPLWWDGLDELTTPGPALDGDLDCDVALVGGGFSALWTAYYLIRQDPSLRIAILEKHHCGFGASGRNGGWAVGELAGSFAKYAARSSPAESLRLSRAVFDAVDEIGRVAITEGIECDFCRAGTLRLARNSPQADRQCDEIAEVRAHGFTEDEIRLLSPDEARERLDATDVRSAILLTPSARVHPAKLVLGLVRTLRAAGVEIYEQTEVAEISDGVVRTERGLVRAPVVVRATEAYSRDLPGAKRDLLPVYSLMIATEPLTADTWDQIGLSEPSTFADDRHMVIYGQRTADDRIAFGRPGIPYLYGSKVSASNEQHLPSHETAWRVLREMFPGLEGTQVTHRWGGVLGIPRNWVPGLSFDRTTGRGVLGGYVGEGVAAANLAGRTMADLALGNDTDRTSLPWVEFTARRWEVEPFRWLGVRGSRLILGRADAREYSRDTEAGLSFRLSRLLRGGN